MNIMNIMVKIMMITIQIIAFQNIYSRISLRIVFTIYGSLLRTGIPMNHYIIT